MVSTRSSKSMITRSMMGSSTKAKTTGSAAPSSATVVDFSAFAAPSSPPKRSRPSGRWNTVSPDTSTPKSPKENKGAKSNKGKPKDIGLTRSFAPKTAADFLDLKDRDIEIHTLVLGTHPGIKSLEEAEYYGHSMNKFWWIAGDCLGFRRGAGLGASGKPYTFIGDLRHDNILPYEKQMETFCSKGFALWDIIAACKRPGSLDSNIKKDQANDIRGFCKKHPSIRRIVIANGASGCVFFKKHFSDWLDSGEIVPCSHPATLAQFKQWDEEFPSPSAIKVISALAVSPAAAMYSYAEKRDFWEKYVYKPGLASFEAAQRLTKKRKRAGSYKDN